MTTQFPLVDRVLLDVHANPDQTAEQRAGRVDTNAKAVHTACWTLRNKGLLTSDNHPTPAGLARIEELCAPDDATATPAPTTAEPTPEKPRRGRKPGKKAKKRSAPPQATAVGVPAIPEAPPATRLEAVHRVADSVIANARNSHRVLRAYLDETVEITPLLESLLDNCAGSITLIEQTYHAAR